MHLKGIKLAEGWENRPFNYKDLSCFKENIKAKGEDNVARKVLDWGELDPKILKLRKQGETIKDISLKLNLGHATVHRRLKVLEQAKEPVTEPTAKLETVEEETQPAEESITDSLTDDEPIPYTLCGTDMPEKETIRMIVRARFNIAEEMVMDLLDSPLALKMVKELIELGAI